MTHPASFFLVQFVKQARTSWSRSFEGMEWRGFNDDHIKVLADFWITLKQQQEKLASSWLEHLRTISKDPYLATLLRITEELLRCHEGSDQYFESIIELCCLFVSGQFESNQWVVSMSSNLHDAKSMGAEAYLHFKYDDDTSASHHQSASSSSR